MMWKWFKVCYNGGKAAVWAPSEEAALKKYAGYVLRHHHVFPGTTVSEISAEEAETYWYKVR